MSLYEESEHTSVNTPLESHKGLKDILDSISSMILQVTLHAPTVRVLLDSL